MQQLLYGINIDGENYGRMGMTNSNMIVCPRCHALIQPVAVHGHYQCQICKSNIDDCCSGEVCQPINISQEEDDDKMTTYKSP